MFTVDHTIYNVDTGMVDYHFVDVMNEDQMLKYLEAWYNRSDIYDEFEKFIEGEEND